MEHIMASALGEQPCDLVLKNAQYVNVFTGEVYPAEIGVTDGRIAHVTQPGEDGLTGAKEYDCRGKYVVPGLIDTHVHIESSMMTPANFARVVVPRGTTTVLADPHELCNVLGVEGMEYCGKAGTNIVLRVLWAVPSCVPSVLGVESNKMPFHAEEIGAMLDLPHAAALGEVMDYPGVIARNPRMMAILAEAKKRGKLIAGHVIGVTPRELSAYQIAGVESDHEARVLDEVLMKLRAGMVVECRYASSAKNVPVEAKALAMVDYPVNAVFCTDDREVDDLLRHGHMDEVIRQAVAHGVPPVKAVQMATRNAALFLGLKDRGSLRAGNLADMVVVDDLETFVVDAVFVGGVLCGEGGKLVVDIDAHVSAVETRNTMNVRGELSVRDFQIPASGETVRLNGMSFLHGDPFHTTLKETAFTVRDGYADIGSVENFVTMAVVERHNATGNIGLAPAENIGLTKGAIAGTVAHDSHNLFVFGRNTEDMAIAARELVNAGGGFVAVVDGKVTAEVRLPVCGLVSTKPAEEIAAEVRVMQEALRSMGICSESPIHVLTWFCLAVLPEVRLTDKGLVDTTTQRPLPLIAD